MKKYHHLGLLTGALAILVAAQEVSAANTKFTDIEINKNKSAIELQLKTLGTEEKVPQILTTTKGNTTITDIFESKLSLQQNEKLSHNNPFPGIEKLEIKQIGENNVRIVATGENQAPEQPILFQETDGVTLSLSSEIEAKAKSLTQKTEAPKLAQALEQENPPIAQQDPDVLVPNPEIEINGQPVDNPVLPSATPPPLLPRAVAPPVGDIAVSNINSAPELLDLGTSTVVPRLVLKDAPVREVLGLLARSAGLNLVYTTGDEEAVGPTISLDLQNQSVQEVFNSVLLVSGLQANRKGTTIFVGNNLPQQARNVITRTLRLNQVNSSNAAAFLATQGAAVQRIVTPIEEITDPVTQRVVRRIEQPSELRPLAVVKEKGSTAPLLLRGLTVTTDDRLNSLTMVGEPRQIDIATSFVTQLDARRRQVAVNLKIIDVNLANTDNFNASLSFGVGDGFFVSDNGAAVFNYGGVNPPTAGDANRPGAYPQVIDLRLPPGVEAQPFLDRVEDSPFGEIDQALGTPFARPNFGSNLNPFQPGVVEITEDGTITFELPQLFEVPDDFLATIQAQIVSGNAKILTDPTLIVQEGQEATVKLIQEVITSVETEIDTESGVRTVTPKIGEAGLSLTVNIDRIDDNGFISLSVSPRVSAIGQVVNFDSGGADNQLSLLDTREVSSGAIRLRDSQTLILTGIIQETDKTTVSKVPLLGDIPLLGALFRSTQRENERNEVIVLLTPQILDDSNISGWGYNYNPSQEAGELLRRQGFPVPGPSR